MCSQRFVAVDGESCEGVDIYSDFFDSSADRGKLDLSACGGRFCWTSVDLGASGCDCGRKFDGSRGYADFYSVDFCSVFSFSRMGALPFGDKKKGDGGRSRRRHGVLMEKLRSFCDMSRVTGSPFLFMGKTLSR